MNRKVKQKLIVANWKMHKTPCQARQFWEAFAAQSIPAGVDVVICPSFLALPALIECTQQSRIAVGAQDGHWHAEGAYTGDVSMAMLQEVGATYVLVGHSERRMQHEEDDACIQRKVVAARNHHLRPIICVGERAEERIAGQAMTVVRRQVERALATVPADGLCKVILAYEPVWSIGTGQAASPADAGAMVANIRSTLCAWGEGVKVEEVPILYGGSVSTRNIQEYLACGMHGVLVGRASLSPRDFHALLVAAGGMKTG